MPTSIEAPSWGRHRSAPGPAGGPRRVRRSLIGAAIALVVAVLAVVVGLWRAGPDDAAPESDPSASVVSAVGDAAERMLTTWARPEIDYAQWWSDLKPLLSAGALVDYAQTDPSQLPELKITGEPDIVEGPSEDTVTVYFATTAGRFGVDMSRRGVTSGWRMIRILFPGQKSTYS